MKPCHQQNCNSEEKPSDGPMKSNHAQETPPAHEHLKDRNGPWKACLCTVLKEPESSLFKTSIPSLHSGTAWNDAAIENCSLKNDELERSPWRWYFISTILAVNLNICFTIVTCSLSFHKGFACIFVVKKYHARVHYGLLTSQQQTLFP